MSTTLPHAFLDQAKHCAALDSPFMANLLHLMARNWPKDSDLATICDGFTGDIGPTAASIPLRICGGLHALVLSGQDSDLAAVFPPVMPDDATLWAAVEQALRGHLPFWQGWMQNAPQTNEVRRAAALIAASHLLADRYKLPIRLSELGASGGLNLMFDRFALNVAGQTYGPSSPVSLSPDWQGPVPAKSTPSIAERRGVDLNPLDAHSPDGALRLTAYLWADQHERLTRTRAAISLLDAEVDKSDAIDWLATRLTHKTGQLHLIYHTIAWQYFPKAAQETGIRLIEQAGQAATDDTPIAWLRLEADENNQGAGLSLRLWPGDHHIELARVDFHGRWINWTGPIRLP
jgi:hypothetical protein